MVTGRMKELVARGKEMAHWLCPERWVGDEWNQERWEGMTVSKSGNFASNLLESLPLVSSKQRGRPILALPYFWPQDLLFSWFSKLPHFTPDFCLTQSFFLLNAWLFLRKRWCCWKKDTINEICSQHGTMDTIGRYVFESFNDPSPKGHPSEHTRLLYRGNSNKMIDKGILKKGKVGGGGNNLKQCSGRNVGHWWCSRQGLKL